MIRRLVTLSRTMIIAGRLPLRFWHEALKYATWVHNRVPSRAHNGKSPFEIRYGLQPDTSMAHQFGARCWVHKLPNEIGRGNKFTQRAFGSPNERAVFVGVSTDATGQKGYRVYIDKKGIQFVVRKSVTFDEGKTWINMGIVFRTGPMLLEGYTDANWGGDKGHKSTSGACFSLNGGAISWLSKRQIPVAVISAESEYYAASLAVQEAKWLRALLSELGVTAPGPTNIAEDNNACIQMTKNPVNHSRCKHIPIRYHFTREAVENGEVRLVPVASNDNVADFLTKVLPKPKFQKFRDFAMGNTR